jgi:hypothetical protein
MGSRLVSRAKNNSPKCMWPFRVHQGWPAKTGLRPGIAHGRGSTSSPSRLLDLAPLLPLFATQTTTTERIRDIQSHGVASTQQTPPGNQPSCPCILQHNILSASLQYTNIHPTDSSHATNKHHTTGVPRRRCCQIMEWSQSMPKALL